MTQKNQEQELTTIRFRYFNHKDTSRNKLIRVYQRKLTIYGDHYLLHTYDKPHATYSSPKERKPKPMKTERDATSFWRAKQNVIRIIDCNVNAYSEKTTFWTFTFDPKRCSGITELSVAIKYFKTFKQRLNRKLAINAKYLTVPEFQKNGNVHYHVVFFNLPFIAVDKSVYEKNPNLLSKKVYDFAMNDIWTYGFCEPVLLEKGIDRISLYISKYMSKSFDSKTGNKTYGEKLYFCSRELKRPEVYYDKPDIYPQLIKYKLKKTYETYIPERELTIRQFKKLE